MHWCVMAVGMCFGIVISQVLYPMVPFHMKKLLINLVDHPKVADLHWETVVCFGSNICHHGVITMDCGGVADVPILQVRQIPFPILILWNNMPNSASAVEDKMCFKHHKRHGWIC